MTTILKTTQYSNDKGHVVTRYGLAHGDLPEGFHEFVGYCRHIVRNPETGDPLTEQDVNFPILLSEPPALEDAQQPEADTQRVVRAFEAFEGCRDDYLPVFDRAFLEHVERQVQQRIEAENARQEQPGKRIISGERHFSKGQEDQVNQGKGGIVT